jgi:hypothetical protein
VNEDGKLYNTRNIADEMNDDDRQPAPVPEKKKRERERAGYIKKQEKKDKSKVNDAIFDADEIDRKRD